MNENYNGWTNYATWRVNLEFFDGINYDGETFEDKFALADRAKESIEQFIDENCEDNFVSGWANAFISDVNFIEIAESILEEYPELIK